MVHREETIGHNDSKEITDMFVEGFDNRLCAEQCVTFIEIGIQALQSTFLQIYIYIYMDNIPISLG